MKTHATKCPCFAQPLKKVKVGKTRRCNHGTLAHMHVCWHAHMHACTHTRMPTCLHSCMLACLHALMSACLHACALKCICVYACTQAGFSQFSQANDNLELRSMNIHLELDSRADTSGAAELTPTQVGHGVCGVWVSLAERLGQAIGRVAWSTSASWLRRIAVHVGVEPVHGRGNVIPHVLAAVCP
jgi:hypothetical protein